MKKVYLALVLLITLLCACGESPQPTYQKTDNDLMRDYEDAHYDCKMESNSQNACIKREKLFNELIKKGYCFDRGEQEWNKCDLSNNVASSNSKNFLLDICEISSADELQLKSCSPQDAANSNNFMTLIITFNENSLTYNGVHGLTCEKNARLGYASPNVIESLCKPIIANASASYKLESQDSVILEFTTANGCIQRIRYKKQESKIYKEDLTMAGNCDKEQRLAFEPNSIQEISYAYR